LAKQLIDKAKIDAKRKRKKLLDPARRAMAQAKPVGPDRLARETMMECLSGQFAAIDMRVAQDVANVRHARRNVLPLGFIMYPLKGPKGDELTDIALAALELAQSDIEASAHYLALTKTCEGMKLKMRLDHRFVSDQPEAIRSVHVIVDGWV
jgi:hypothetical protein